MSRDKTDLYASKIRFKNDFNIPSTRKSVRSYLVRSNLVRLE